MTERGDLKLSLFLSAQLDPAAPLVPQCRELEEQARLAEQLGFHGVFLPHHHLAGVPYLQSVPLLGFLAASTRRLRLGTSVFLLPLRNPVALAEEIATLDVLSGGRIVFGVGLGYRQTEWDAFSVPRAERVARFTESIDVMRRLWTGDAVTHAGAFGALAGARISVPPIQPGGPPLWFGAYGEPAVRRAARLADAWIGSSSVTKAEFRGLRATFLEARRAAGKAVPAEQPLLRETCVAPTREAALATVRRHLGAKLAAYGEWGKATMSVDAAIAECAIVGTPTDAARQMQAWHDELGVNHLLLRVQWPGMPQADVLRTIRLLGEEVLERLCA